MATRTNEQKGSSAQCLGFHFSRVYVQLGVIAIRTARCVHGIFEFFVDRNYEVFLPIMCLYVDD